MFLKKNIINLKKINDYYPIFSYLINNINYLKLKKK